MQTRIADSSRVLPELRSTDECVNCASLLLRHLQPRSTSCQHLWESRDTRLLSFDFFEHSRQRTAQTSRSGVFLMRWRAFFFLVILGFSVSSVANTCNTTETFDRTLPAKNDFSKIFQRAESGNTDAQFEIGLMYESGCGVKPDYERAFHWYRKAANAGHPSAQNNLGGLYLHGLGTTQSDEDAVKWYFRAAVAGNPAAQNNLGYMYETGRVPVRDEPITQKRQALYWYRKSAEAGYASAEFNFGLAYFQGLGVHQDFPEAIKWFRKAANHGLAAAFEQLGIVYDHGWGVPYDPIQARKYYRQAAEKGFSRSTITPDGR